MKIPDNFFDKYRCRISASIGETVLFREKDSLCWVVLRIEKGAGQVRLSGAFTQQFVDWTLDMLGELELESKSQPKINKKIDELRKELCEFPRSSQWSVQQAVVKDTAEVRAGLV